METTVYTWSAIGLKKIDDSSVFDRIIFISKSEGILFENDGEVRKLFFSKPLDAYLRFIDEEYKILSYKQTSKDPKKKLSDLKVSLKDIGIELILN